MENMWEKGKKIFKAGALAGAMSLSPESQAQNMNGWTIISEDEFNRKHLSESDIQTIDLKNNPEYEINNSKLAIRFLDKGGHQVHYWINKNPEKSKPIIGTPNYSGDFVKSDTLRLNNNIEEESESENETAQESEPNIEVLSKEEIEKKEENEILQDIELIKSLEEFSSRFKVYSPWAIDPTKDNKKYEISVITPYKYIPEEIEVLRRSEIIEDIENGKQVLIKGGHGSDFYSLIRHLGIYKDNKEGLIEFIRYSKMLGSLRTLRTKQEKIDLIKDLLGSKVKENLKNLPQYEPPIVAEPERMTYEQLENLTKERNAEDNLKIKRRDVVESKDVNITEKDIEDALEGE